MISPVMYFGLRSGTGKMVTGETACMEYSGIHYITSRRRMGMGIGLGAWGAIMILRTLSMDYASWNWRNCSG